MPRWLADLSLAFIALIWGSTFIVVQNALENIGPITFVAIRFWLAFAMLLLLFLPRMKSISRTEILAGVLIGIFLCFGYVFQTIGLQFTTASKTGFITGLYVALVPLFSLIFLRQAPKMNAVAGLGLAIIGLGLLTLDESLRIQSGDLWVVACAVAFAMHIVTVGRYTDLNYDPVRLAIVQIAIVALIATPAAFVFEQPSLTISANAWWAMAFTGLTATALAYSLQVYVQRYTAPTHVALIYSLEPVFAALFGVTLAGDILGVRELSGCALILVGMVIGELRFDRLFEPDGV